MVSGVSSRPGARTDVFQSAFIPSGAFARCVMNGFDRLVTACAVCASHQQYRPVSFGLPAIMFRVGSDQTLPVSPKASRR